MPIKEQGSTLGDRQYNERKQEILQLLQDQGSMTAKEIAASLDIQYTPASDYISSYLLLYHEQRLVKAKQHEQDKRKFVYSITERGRQRLTYLKQ